MSRPRLARVAPAVDGLVDEAFEQQVDGRQGDAIGRDLVAMAVEARRGDRQGTIAEPRHELALQVAHDVERARALGGVRHEQPQHGALLEPADHVDVAALGGRGAQDGRPGVGLGRTLAPVHEQHRKRLVEAVRALALPDERLPEQDLAQDVMVDLSRRKFPRDGAGSEVHLVHVVGVTARPRDSHQCDL